MWLIDELVDGLPVSLCQVESFRRSISGVALYCIISRSSLSVIRCGERTLINKIALV